MTPCMTNYLKNHPINALLLFTTIDDVWDMMGSGAERNRRRKNLYPGSADL